MSNFWLRVSGIFLGICIYQASKAVYLKMREDQSPLPKISISKSKGKVVGYVEDWNPDSKYSRRIFWAEDSAEKACAAWRRSPKESTIYTIREFQGTLTLHKAKCPPLVQNIELQEEN